MTFEKLQSAKLPVSELTDRYCRVYLQSNRENAGPDNDGRRENGAWEGWTLKVTVDCRYVPSWSASLRPRSADTTLSYSRSHLFPTSTTCALSHEYVLIWVHLRTRRPHTTHTHTGHTHQYTCNQWLHSQLALDSIIKHAARHAISAYHTIMQQRCFCCHRLR